MYRYLQDRKSQRIVTKIEKEVYLLDKGKSGLVRLGKYQARIRSDIGLAGDRNRVFVVRITHPSQPLASGEQNRTRAMDRPSFGSEDLHITVDLVPELDEG